MASKRSFEHYITPTDRIDVELEANQGDITAFTVNYRARIRDRWVDVVRYDTAHDHLHLHRCWREEGNRIESLEDPDDPKRTYNAELSQAEADLLENWSRYRRLMEESLG